MNNPFNNNTNTNIRDFYAILRKSCEVADPSMETGVWAIDPETGWRYIINNKVVKYGDRTYKIIHTGTRTLTKRVDGMTPAIEIPYGILFKKTDEVLNDQITEAEKAAENAGEVLDAVNAKQFMPQDRESFIEGLGNDLPF